MNNFPAMTEEQRQVLIVRLQIYIRTAETAIKAGLATKEDVFNLTVWKIALEALNAPPAPVLKPIELPGKGGVEATSERSIRDWSDGWAAYREEAIKAIRDAGYEVKS